MIYRFGFLLIVLWFCNVSCQTKQKVNVKAGIAISFDDHFIDQWYALRPLLKKYNAKVTFFITCPDSLSAGEIQKLKTLENEGHEIGFHGTIHGRATELIAASGPARYLATEITPGLTNLKRAGFTPRSYAHPGGDHNKQVDSVLYAQGFKILRDVAISRRKLYGVPLYTISPRLMNSIFYDFDKSAEVEALLIDVSAELTENQIYEGLLRAKEEGEVIMLFGHEPLSADSKVGAYGFDISFLETILKQANQLGLKFYTMSELPSQ